MVKRFFKLLKVNYPLVLIFLAALIIRTVHLSTLPNGFFTDEVVSGYVGHFILQNGYDLYGNHLPLIYFDKFGDYRVILPMYITGLSTYIFGINEFAVRFPPAVFGALIVFPIYFMSNILFKHRNMALLSALFIAILPWHIVLSRAQSEGIIGLTVFTFAILFCFKAINDKKPSFVLWAAILYFLTYFLYPSFRLLTPMVLIPLPFMTQSPQVKKYLIFTLLGSLLLTFYISTTPWGQGRFNQTSIFKNQEVAHNIKTINDQAAIALGRNEILLARIFHNKPIGYAREIVNQYLSYYSPLFLFLEGGKPDRYTVPHAGLLFILFSLFLLGLVIPDNKGYKKEYLFLIYLLLIAPVPAVLTYDDVPNLHRSLFMIIPLVILASLGAVKIYKIIPNVQLKYVLSFISAVVISLELVYFVHQYASIATSYRNYQRTDGMKATIEYLIANKGKYRRVYSTTYDDLAVYYLFYTKNFDPKLTGKFKKGELRIGSVDNIIFVDDACPYLHQKAPQYDKNDILLVQGDCENYSWSKEIMKFDTKDSTHAFRFLYPQDQ